MILKNDKYTIRASSIKSDYYIEAESRPDSDIPHLSVKFNFKSIDNIKEILRIVEHKLKENK